MLNAACKTKLKSVDYKSIALPVELQGHYYKNYYNNIKNNQFKNRVIVN